MVNTRSTRPPAQQYRTGCRCSGCLNPRTHSRRYSFMRTSFAKRSAPMMTANQRRRQIIGLLAGHLARMPLALAVSPPREDETRFGPVLTRGYGRKSQNLAFLHSAPPSTPGHGSCEEKLSESRQTRLDVPAEMPLSVTCPEPVEGPPGLPRRSPELVEGRSRVNAGRARRKDAS